MAPRFDPRFSSPSFHGNVAGAGRRNRPRGRPSRRRGVSLPSRNADLLSAPPTADMPRKLPPGKSIAYAGQEQPVHPAPRWPSSPAEPTSPRTA